MGKDLRPACLAQEKEMPTHMGLQGHTYKLDSISKKNVIFKFILKINYIFTNHSNHFKTHQVNQIIWIRKYIGNVWIFIFMFEEFHANYLVYVIRPL